MSRTVLPWLCTHHVVAAREWNFGHTRGDVAFHGHDAGSDASRTDAPPRGGRRNSPPCGGSSRSREIVVASGGRSQHGRSRSVDGPIIPWFYSSTKFRT